MTYPSLNNPNKMQATYFNPVYKISNVHALTGTNAYQRFLLNQVDDSTLLLSPEQLEDLRSRNTRPEYDFHKADVFSLGLVGLEMATYRNSAEYYDLDQVVID